MDNNRKVIGADPRYDLGVAVLEKRGFRKLQAAFHATAAAAISVTRAGVQPSLANQDEVLALLESAVAKEVF